MNVIACRWDVPALSALIAGNATVDLIIDAWEAQHRDLEPKILDRIRSLSIVSSFDSLEAMGAVAHRLRDAQAGIVVSFAEFSQQGAAYLAALLGVDGAGMTQSVAVRDKAMMKDLARAAGITCARQIVLEGDPDIEHLFEVLGSPIVVKPLAGMGTVDTRVCDDAESVRAHVASVDKGTILVAEEYVRGTELHIDAVWQDGQAEMLGIGRYLRPRVEIVDEPGHLNGSALLRRSQHRELYEATEALSTQINKAFGVTMGITHVEVFQSPDGRLIFSEIATRPGGGAICDLYELLGADLRTLWMEVEMGTATTPLQEPPYSFTGWVNIVPTGDGIVSAGPTLDDVRARPEVLHVIPGHAVGDRVSAVHTATWSWRIFFGADDWGTFVEQALAIERDLQFEVTPLDADHGA